MRDFNLLEMNDNAHMLGNPYKSVQDARQVSRCVKFGRVKEEMLLAIVEGGFGTRSNSARRELNRRNSL